jgi:hypothetical protein
MLKERAKIEQNGLSTGIQISRSQVAVATEIYTLVSSTSESQYGIFFVCNMSLFYADFLA